MTRALIRRAAATATATDAKPSPPTTTLSNQPLPPLSEPLAVRPPEAARLLSVSEGAIRALVARGRLVAIRPLGHVMLVPMWSLRRLIGAGA